jgi:hypothetical protein
VGCDVSYDWRLSLCSRCLVIFSLAGKETIVSVFQVMFPRLGTPEEALYRADALRISGVVLYE